MVGESGEDDGVAHHPLDFFYGYFSERIEELRAEPRGDVLTGMAQALPRRV
jgi:cytochrome P450 family 150 subfamily A5